MMVRCFPKRRNGRCIAACSEMEGFKRMTATIIASESRFEVEARNQTVLDAIQEAGIDFSAPCGGNGTCGKCQVLIHDGEGLHYLLACQTDLEDGMEVHVESQQPMTIQVSGSTVEYPGRSDAAGYGLATDIGTTTMVSRLHDLKSGSLIASSSRVNPQVVYGADVIARITACMEGHLEDMTDLVRNALDEMADDLCREAGIKRREITDIALVGNTVIEHLAARLSPITIGVSPFEPLSYFGDSVPFEPVGKQAYFAPALSGYIGGDITAGILSCRIHEAEGMHVFLDLGTNGELAIGNKDRMTCCATAAGPVFEGANVFFGMPARTGAISSVSFNGASLDLAVIGDAQPVGICGTGLIEAIALMVEQEVIDESGRILYHDELDEFWHPFVGKTAEGTVFYLTADHSVYITQADVRNVQLAKAAICAGILTLLDSHDMGTDDIDALLVAGGFGSFLNIEAAARIGLFPEELLDRASSVGNAAVEGASLLLTSDEARAEVSDIAQSAEYIELSTCAAFNSFYMECMAFE